jgi:hypothetical protein
MPVVPRAGSPSGFSAPHNVPGHDLTRLWTSGATDERVLHTIREGVPNTIMPSSSAPDDEVWALVSYLRNVNGAGTIEAVKGNTEIGERIFWSACGSCHTVNGRGGPLGPDLSRISGSDFPTRGCIDAYDPKTGARLWRFYTVPGPGEVAATRGRLLLSQPGACLRWRRRECTLIKSMTFAELILLVSAGIGIYYVLRPLQRRLEIYLLRKLFARHPRPRRPTIDVTGFTSYLSHKKEDHDHRS